MLEFNSEGRLVNLRLGVAQTPEQIELIPKIENILIAMAENVTWRLADKLGELWRLYGDNSITINDILCQYTDHRCGLGLNVLDGKITTVTTDDVFFCSFCQEYHSLEHTDKHVLDDGNVVCDRVMKTKVCKCRVCNKTFLQIYDPYEKMCRQCVEDARKYRIKRYHDNPILDFYNENGKTLDLNNEDFYGLELEVDRGGEDNDMSKDVIKLLQERVYTMHDGSLNNGFEIITHPHTEKALMNLNWKETFKWLIHKGYRSHDISTCGLHLHINRSVFKNEDSLAKMLYFYEKNFDEIIKVSRRELSRANRWAGRYCHYSDDVTLDKMHEILEDYDSRGEHDSRYKCVNLQKRHTVEIRIMRGTLNYNSFMACLDFMITVAKNSNKVRDIDNWEEWLEGINDNTKNYLSARRAFGYPPEEQVIEDDCYNMTKEEIKNMEEIVCAL